MKIIKKELKFYSKYYFKIIDIINSAGGNARIVGGAVRDALLQTLPSDIDIATKLKPAELIVLFEKHGLKSIPTGIKFGTITVVYYNESFQITTLRSDISCDGRHAQVEYTDDYEEDAKRRDFTINALSYCPVTQEIYDYFGGIDDLENQRVIFIGDANERISEDYLRILRFYRFTCNYANAVDEVGAEACFNHKEMLTQLSKERIKSEMDKILIQKNSPPIISAMNNTQILNIIFPQAKYDTLIHQEIIKIANFYDYYDYTNIIYALIFKDTNIDIQNLTDLKFSKKDARDILKLIKVTNLNENYIGLSLRKIWLEEIDFVQYFIIIAAINGKREEVYQTYLDLKDFDKPIFPVNGDDLKYLGHVGEEIGIFLNRLRKIWIERNFKISKEELIKIAHDDLL
ncbi:MAG: CCA tRNA nucleotidyltransferase [Acinetobacter sp.]|uniref:CCA tRNA nucleotidyltransferase n=1 Tax=Acinetobacter sp. TaxID=472 RepID=UPI000FBBE795|nr:CCA tRNA nucleotidyltransferase [Acinetobacter sp.]RUP42029.1 MAG: CCA tRNA nucleotidyltransferase [Acinetobacter sp.]